MLESRRLFLAACIALLPGPALHLFPRLPMKTTDVSAPDRAAVAMMMTMTTTISTTMMMTTTMTTDVVAAQEEGVATMMTTMTINSLSCFLCQ